MDWTKLKTSADTKLNDTEMIIIVCETVEKLWGKETRKTMKI